MSKLWGLEDRTHRQIWPGYWMTQLNIMNQNVYKENGKALNKVNVWYQKVCRISRNKFWKNIVCLVSDPTFGLVESILWDKEN